MIRSIRVALSAALCVTGASAWAADLPRRAAPPPVYVPMAPVFTWTGIYVGGYAGGTFGGDVRVTNQLGVTSGKRDGFTGGGLGGVNYQIGKVVVGVEGDLGYDGSRARSTFGVPGAPSFTVNGTQTTDSVMGRVRGRVGYALGHTMIGETLLFAAGGASFLREQFVFSALGNTVTVRKDRDGYNVGGGVDVAFRPNWIARVEYVYDDYGRARYAAPPGGLPFRAQLHDNTVRAALMYKF